jgi:chromosome segregation ATPase
MSEIKNTYLDLAGLKRYDELIKGFIANGHTELAEAITALNDRLGSLEFEGSDDKNLTGIVESIYTSIADIVEKQIALEEKDAAFEAKDIELAAQIKVIADNLEWAMGGNSENEATIGEINNRLDELKGSVDKIAADVDTAVEAANQAQADATKAKEDAAAAVADAAAAVADAAAATGIANQAQADATKAKEDAAAATDVATQAQADAAAAVEAATQAQTDAAAAVADAAAATAAIEILNGEGVGSVKDTAAAAAAEAVAAVVADADSDFDTLKEVADWIYNDKTGAAALQIAVAEHTGSINTINGDIDALEEKVDEDIEKLKEHMSDAATVIAGVEGRLDRLEAFEETHSSIDLNDIDGLFSDNTGSEPEE